MFSLLRRVATAASAFLTFLFMLTRLIVFATCLVPAALGVVVYYLRPSQVKRSVRYGTKPRNKLDIHGFIDIKKSEDANKRPVVVFFTGGAWMIGTISTLLCADLH